MTTVHQEQPVLRVGVSETVQCNAVRGGTQSYQQNKYERTVVDKCFTLVQILQMTAMKEGVDIKEPMEPKV